MAIAFLEVLLSSVANRVPLPRRGFWSFYKAINKVDRSLIRTDAIEVTYDLRHDSL